MNALTFDRCLEMGCGTGKNTVWLKGKARHITAVDFSAEMLNLARQKFSPDQIEFVQADISRPWDFLKEKYSRLIKQAKENKNLKQLSFLKQTYGGLLKSFML